MNAYDNVIITDFDGCCAYWEHGFHMWMIDNGYKIQSTGYYEIHDKYGITEEKANRLIQAFNESAALRRLPPVRDAIKYIRKLHEEHGYVFHCISAIPDTRDMYDARMENIHNLFGKTAFEKLTLCNCSDNKKELLKQYEGSGCFWIEDLEHNSAMGLEYGLKCVLIEHHYNINCTDPRLIKVKTWKEIYSHITGDSIYNV